jgi:hypothetical protein
VTKPGVADLDRVFRQESGRAVAVLARFLGDIDCAEEAVQEAFAAAAQTGTPSAGDTPPRSPPAAAALDLPARTLRGRGLRGVIGGWEQDVLHAKGEMGGMAPVLADG